MAPRNLTYKAVVDFDTIVCQAGLHSEFVTFRYGDVRNEKTAINHDCRFGWGLPELCWPAFHARYAYSYW